MRINPAKVPRLIGKEGSMINMIKDKTGCRINVGQNGRIWLDGGETEACLKAISMIEEGAAVEGLTDRVAAFLSTVERKDSPSVTEEAPQMEEAEVWEGGES